MASINVRVVAAVLAFGLSGACASRATMRPVPQQDQTTSQQEDERHKSYIFPVIEIIGMDAAINRIGSVILDPATFAVSGETIRRNLREPWVVDDDPFEINQVGHPYQGAMP
jgi:hypothetical protein